MGWTVGVTFGLFVFLGLVLSSRWDGRAKRAAPIVAGLIALAVGVVLRSVTG
jgi:hypothetical protein